MRSFLPFLLLLVASPAAFGQTPRTPHSLNPAGEADSPVVATDGELTVATWHDGFPNYRVHCSVSRDQGRTWSAPVVIDNASGAYKTLHESGTRVAGEHIYVTWSDDRLGASVDQYFTMSHDGGLTWSTDLTLDKGYPAGTHPVQDYRMDANESHIFVLMKLQEPAGAEELWATRSADGGLTWEPAHDIFPPGDNRDIDAIDLAVDDDRAHVIWLDDLDPWFAGHPDEKNLWSQLIDLNVPGSGGFAYLLSNDSHLAGNTSGFQPSISAAEGYAVVTWIAATNGMFGPWQVRARPFDRTGFFGWGPEIPVGNYNPALGSSAANPRALITETGEMFITWEDNRSGLGQDEIYVARSTDLGASFQELAQPLGLGTSPRIEGEGDYFGVSFTTGTFPNYGTRMAVSRDGGLDFGIPIDLTAASGSSNSVASLAFNTRYSNFFATWQDGATAGLGGWVGGLRVQTTTPVGTFAAGNLVNFRASRFGTGESGHEFMVVASPATGSTLIQGDGRDLFLANTGVLIHSYQNPLLKATLNANGDASTPLVTFPPSFAAGTTLYFVGLSRNAGDYGSISDVIEVVVQ